MFTPFYALTPDPKTGRKIRVLVQRIESRGNAFCRSEDEADVGSPVVVDPSALSLLDEQRILATDDENEQAPTTWGEFKAANVDDPGLVADVERDLVRGRHHSGGGGAQPVYVVSLFGAV